MLFQPRGASGVQTATTLGSARMPAACAPVSAGLTGLKSASQRSRHQTSSNGALEHHPTRPLPDASSWSPAATSSPVVESPSSTPGQRASERSSRSRAARGKQLPAGCRSRSAGPDTSIGTIHPGNSWVTFRVLLCLHRRCVRNNSGMRYYCKRIRRRRCAAGPPGCGPRSGRGRGGRRDLGRRRAAQLHRELDQLAIPRRRARSLAERPPLASPHTRERVKALSTSWPRPSGRIRAVRSAISPPGRSSISAGRLPPGRLRPEYASGRRVVSADPVSAVEHHHAPTTGPSGRPGKLTRRGISREARGGRGTISLRSGQSKVSDASTSRRSRDDSAPRGLFFARLAQVLRLRPGEVGAPRPRV